MSDRRVPPWLLALLAIACLAAAASIVAFVVTMRERPPARIPDAQHQGFGEHGPVMHLPPGITCAADPSTRTLTVTGSVDAAAEAEAREHVRLNLLRSDWKVVWGVEVVGPGSASAATSR